MYLLGGRVIGFYHQATAPDGEGGLRTEVREWLAVDRAGERFTASRHEIWLEGEELRRLEVESDLNGQRQRLEVEAAPGGFAAALGRGGAVDRRLVPADGPVLGAHGAAARVLEAARRGSRELDFQVLLPDEERVERVRVSLRGEGELADSAGRVHRGTLVEERLPSRPQLVTLSVVDPRDGLLYSRLSAGLPLEKVRREWGPGELEELLSGSGPAADGALDVLSLGIPLDGVPPWKEGGAGVREARLRFSGEGRALLEERLRETARDLGGAPDGRDGPVEVRRAADSLEVRLRAPRRPASPEQAPPPGALPAEAAGWLGDGFHLDLADPRLDDLLAGARRGDRLDPAALSDRVFQAIRRKSTRLGFAGSREVLDSREGDCTEHAVLLTALLRRAGRPARVAYGFVLLGDRFSGHAWTEAWLEGRWQWLDPSFRGEEGRRLKLRLGVLDPARPLPGGPGLDLLQVVGSVRATVLDWREE